MSFNFEHSRLTLLHNQLGAMLNDKLCVLVNEFRLAVLDLEEGASYRNIELTFDVQFAL